MVGASTPMSGRLRFAYDFRPSTEECISVFDCCTRGSEPFELPTHLNEPFDDSRRARWPAAPVCNLHVGPWQFHFAACAAAPYNSRGQHAKRWGMPLAIKECALWPFNSQLHWTGFFRAGDARRRP